MYPATLHWGKPVFPSQQVSIINSFLMRGGTGWQFPFSVLVGSLSGLNLCGPRVCCTVSEFMHVSALSGLEDAVFLEVVDDSGSLFENPKFEASLSGDSHPADLFVLFL